MPRRARIFDFQRFHHFGVAGPDMVMARQMQNAVHHQMGGMIGNPFAGLFGFTARYAQGQRHIAAIFVFVGRGRKRQNVGGFVLAAKITIERLQFAVIREQHGEREGPAKAGPLGGRGGGAREPGHKPAKFAPTRIVHHHKNAFGGHLPCAL